MADFATNGAGTFKLDGKVYSTGYSVEPWGSDGVMVVDSEGSGSGLGLHFLATTTIDSTPAADFDALLNGINALVQKTATVGNITGATTPVADIKAGNDQSLDTARAVPVTNSIPDYILRSAVASEALLAQALLEDAKPETLPTVYTDGLGTPTLYQQVIADDGSDTFVALRGPGATPLADSSTLLPYGGTATAAGGSTVEVTKKALAAFATGVAINDTVHGKLFLDETRAVVAELWFDTDLDLLDAVPADGEVGEPDSAAGKVPLTAIGYFALNPSAGIAAGDQLAKVQFLSDPLEWHNTTDGSEGVVAAPAAADVKKIDSDTIDSDAAAAAAYASVIKVPIVDDQVSLTLSVAGANVTGLRLLVYDASGAGGDSYETEADFSIGGKIVTSSGGDPFLPIAAGEGRILEFTASGRTSFEIFVIKDAGAVLTVAWGQGGIDSSESTAKAKKTGSGTLTGTAVQSHDISDSQLPLSVIVYPEAGDTVLAEGTYNSGTDWIPLVGGAASTSTVWTVDSALTNVRFTGSNAGATTSKWQVA